MNAGARFLLIVHWSLFIIPALNAEEASDRLHVHHDPGGFILVSGTLNEQSVKCIIDTGASHHAIDVALKPHLGECRPYKAPRVVEICEPPNLIIQGFTDVEPAEAAVLDLSDLREASSTEFDVIVGLPFLVNRVLELNPLERRFTLSTDASGWSYETEMEITVDHLGRPCVPISINGHAIEALIDTGSTAEVTLRPEDFRLVLGNQNTNPVSLDRQVQIYAMSGRADRQVIKVDTLELGGTKVAGCTAVEHESTTIGLGLLSRFRVEIDLDAMRLSIAETVLAESAPEEHECSGFEK